MLRVPWLNMQSQMAEWGFHCVGCLHVRWLHSSTPKGDKPTHYMRDFLVSTFLEHLKEFGPVRDGRHHTGGCCEAGTCSEKGQFVTVMSVMATDNGFSSGPYWAI